MLEVFVHILVHVHYFIFAQRKLMKIGWAQNKCKYKREVYINLKLNIPEEKLIAMPGWQCSPSD